MTTKAKRYTAMLLAGLSILALSACGGEDPDNYIEGKNPGKEIEQSAAADAVFTLNYNTKYSMNPILTTNTNNQLVCNLVYENMIELDNNFEAVPNVITEWKTSDGGEHWVFTVDTSRRFHNGEQMTAEDVAYSLRCAVNSNRFGRKLLCVIGVSANDEKTFAVTLSKKNLLLPQLLAVPVIKKGSMEEDYPDGTGPYAYADDHKSLVKFDKYKNSGALPLDTVYLKEYTGTTETITAFEDSLIDVVLNDPSAPTNLGYATSNEIRPLNTTNLHYIGFNVKDGEFAYDGLRYAMNFAIDRDDIVNQFSGYASAATLPVSPACAWYDSSYAKQFGYDINQVQTVLSNMGLKDYDDDGMLEMKVGSEISEIDLDFIVCSASAVKTAAAAKFASDMEKIGLKVTVRQLSWSNYKLALSKGEFDMYYAEVRLSPDFDLSMLVADGARMNFGGIKDEMLDELILRYLAADEANRKAACADMCAQLANRAYIIPICFEKHQMITHRGVIEGIKANETNPLYGFANWKISFDNVVEKPQETKTQ